MLRSQLIRRSTSTPTTAANSWERLYPRPSWPLHYAGALWSGANDLAGSSPAVDVYRDDDRYLIHVDLPGLTKEQVEVSIDNNVLTVAGNRELTNGGEGFEHSERWSGHFLRTFALSDKVDAEKVSARFDNGVLEIEIPKSPDSKLRRITIH